MFKKIDGLRFWCNKILPLVYDDSLSYYETLCKIAEKLNEVINDINEIPQYIRDLVSDEKLKEIMQTLLNNLQEQIASANEGTSKTATEVRTVGELVWLNGELYKITHNMIAGDQYVENSNCVKITIEEQIKTIYNANEETLKINGIFDGDNGDNYFSKLIFNENEIKVKDSNAQLLCSNLRNDLNAEIYNRTNDVTNLRNDLNTEISTRENNVTNLEEKIQNETKARIENDNLIRNQIEELKKPYKSAYIEEYGGKSNDATFDNKTAYERAINDGVTELKLQSGDYYFSEIKLYNGVSIKGCGQYKTFIIPLKESTTNNFIYLDVGPVAYCHYSDFCVKGNEIANQNGWGIIGVRDSTSNDGGMWYCNFENIITFDFLGYQLYMYNNNDQTLPNQFITFTNCRFFGSLNSKDAVHINTGNQIVFIGGQITLYDTSTTTSNYALYCKGDIVLIKTAIEYCNNGIAISSDTYLTIISPWFEGVKKVIKQVDFGAFTTHLNIYGGEVRVAGVDTEEFLNVIQRFSANIYGLAFLGGAIKKGVVYGAGNNMCVTFDNCSGIKPKKFIEGDVTKAISDMSLLIDSPTVPIALINGGTLKNINGATSVNYSWGNVKTPITIYANVTINNTGNITTVHQTLLAGKTYLAEYVPQTNTWIIY